MLNIVRIAARLRATCTDNCCFRTPRPQTLPLRPLQSPRREPRRRAPSNPGPGFACRLSASRAAQASASSVKPSAPLLAPSAASRDARTHARTHAAMSFAQERAAALPPPPPSPRVGSYPQETPSHTHQTSPLRRIAVQPPIITTQLAPPPGQYPHGHTPASATSLNPSFSPYAPTPSSYAPSPIVPPSPMAMRNPGYNPQQWARTGGTVGGQYVPHPAAQTPVAATRPQDVTGMEGMYAWHTVCSLMPSLPRRAMSGCRDGVA